MHDVDIFGSDLDVEDSSASGLLSAEELARATRFRFDRDRRRYVNCRATLRRILAGYIRMEPTAINFRYNAYGKPAVVNSDVDAVYFNVSHADRVAMIAVSQTLEIGIDVERIDPAFAHEQIPQQFFSPREVATLRALPDSQQLEAFFGYWTRKEAYMKARGLGFALEPTSFDFACLPGEWSLEPIEAPPGYIAALCREDRGSAPNRPVRLLSNLTRNEITACDTL